MAAKKNLTDNEIAHLAELAGLTLTNEEIKKYGKQLVETLIYVTNLNTIQTKNISTTDHVVNVVNVFFDDGKQNTRKLKSTEVFSNTKEKKGDYFVVERIL